MAKFSVIVPVYNVEKYLDECVKSVLTQSFTDWEMILVDDGSTDGCPAMCDEFSKKDSRIKVIHKKNGGSSSARNAGLKVAGGDYIIFLDSDDFYNDEKAFETFANNLKNDEDVLVFGCTDFNMNTGKTIVSRTGYDIELISKNDCAKTLHYLLSSKMIPGSAWLFCFKRNLVVNNQISFKEGIQNEDYDFVLSVFTSCKSINAIDNPFYSYRQGRAESITGSSNIKMIYGIEYTINKWIKRSENIENEVIKKDVLNYIAFIYSTGFVVCGRMKGDTNKQQAVKILKKYKHILKFGYWKKTKIIKISVKIFGMPLFSTLSAAYFKMTHI